MVKNKNEKIIEGSYQYFSHDKPYAQEEFKVFLNPESRNVDFEIERIARLQTGELLKTSVQASFSPQHTPILATVEHRVGEKRSFEHFVLDTKSNTLHYQFENGTEKRTFEKGWAVKHFISLPCFTLSAFFLNSKKLDPKAPNQIFVVRSPNDFDFKGPLEDVFIFVEQPITDEVGKNKANPVTTIHIYPEIPDTKNTPECTTYKLSKYFYIPLEMTGPDGIKILSLSLKRYGSYKDL